MAGGRVLETASTLVARALAQRAPEARAQFLREVMAHSAAGLCIVEGDESAAEAVYRLADAVVTRKDR